MCLEDIKIGRHTVDSTHSQKITDGDLGSLFDMVIPANQYRTRLLIWGIVDGFTTDPEIPGSQIFGWIEVWLDQAPPLNPADNLYDHLVVLLPISESRIMMRIEDYGLLIQRSFTLRPTFSQHLKDVATDIGITMGYTDFVMPENTKYLE